MPRSAPRTTRRFTACCARRAARTAVAAAVALAAAPAAAQDNPVYIDDSPQARQQFRLAQDQSRENLGEAVRLYQELLDETPFKLIPVSDTATDHATSVRRRVLDAIAADEALLQRYRQMQTAEARRLLDAGRVRDAALTRPLTAPGLEALLILAQQAFEDGRFDSARRWLAEAGTHPDLTGRAALYEAYLAAATAHFTGRDAQRDDALAWLRAAGPDAEPFRRELEALVAAAAPASPAPAAAPAVRTGHHVLHRTDGIDLTQLVPQSIWSYEWSATPPARGDGPGRLPGREPPRDPVDDTDLITAAATIAQQHVFVNESHRVVALDRFTGREIWTHTVQPHAAAGPDDPPLDLNLVSVRGDAVVTLTGYGQGSQRAGGGAVLCLDTDTGHRRWERSFDALGGDEELDGLYPHGVPLIGEQNVYILARRLTRQQVTASYIVALDRQTGEPAWVRFISAAGGLQPGARPLSSLIAHDGSLFVANHVGAVARLDAATGEVRWLRKQPVDLTGLYQRRRPWEFTSPVVTGAGLVVLRGDGRMVMRLDAERGDLLAAHDAGAASGWNAPRYLLGHGRMVYGIGTETIVAFDIDDLARPLWRVPAPATSHADADPRETPLQDDLELAGRVQLVDSALIVPTVEDVRIVDAETGVVVHRLDGIAPGNPVAADGQLLLAGPRQLASYMAFERARDMLRQLIADTPTDPAPALSLMQVAQQARDDDLLLEAARSALRAVNAADADAGSDGRDRDRAALQREQLLHALLQAGAAAGSEAIGDELFALADAVAVDPPARTDYLLAYGRWLAEHRIAEAVETYGSVLADPLLASTWGRMDDTLISGEARAAARLRELIERHGETVYAAPADFAAMRLKQLLAGGDPDPTALAELARHYPFADAAVDAAVHAAHRLHAAGETRRALAGLRRTYAVHPTARRAAALLGVFADICTQDGWNALAESTLRQALRQHGDITLQHVSDPPDTMREREDRDDRDDTDAGQPTLRNRLAAIADPTSGDLPRIGIPGPEARALEGQLLPTHPAAEPVRRDRFLVHHGDRLRLHHAEDLAAAWAAVLDVSAPRVLALSNRDVVLWLDDVPDDPQAVVLDADTGAYRWTTPRLSEVFRDGALAPPRRDGVKRMPNDEVFDPAEVLPRLTRDMLYIVRRDGSVAAFHRGSGDAKWTARETLDEVHHAAVHDAGLILVGMARRMDPDGPGSDLAPAAVVLDRDTGGVAHEWTPLDRSGARWMCIGPMAELALGSAEGIETFDLLSGRRLWRHVHEQTVNGRAFADRVLIEAAGRTDLAALTFADATPIHGFSPSVADPFLEDPQRPSGREIRQVRVAGDAAYVLHADRMVRYDTTGRVTGADAVTGERDYRTMHLGADGLAIISTDSQQVQVRPGQRHEMRYEYEIHLMASDGRLLGRSAALQSLPRKVTHTALIDAWVLLSTDERVLAVPLDTR